MNNEVLLELKSIEESVAKNDGFDHKILNNIDFTLRSGEIVAILGKSGSGKSTLLRIIAGLEPPNSGTIECHVKHDAKNFGMSMIFQSFALFPWLTVFENVELGLETMDLTHEERKKRVIEVINLIGLNGFESAYPRELSSGMKQRVGFARALVVRPAILLMDEPFSALDILTSNTLKSDFLELWQGKKTPLKSAIIVTHSIEEAVMMADRVVVLGAKSGHFVSELQITLPRPRDSQSGGFHDIIDQIYIKMSEASQGGKDITTVKDRLIHITQKLPHAYPNQLTALASAIISESRGGEASFARLAKILHLDISVLLYTSEALEMLKFATTQGGDIKLTETGLRFALNDIVERKKIFAEVFLHHIPIIAYICKVIRNNKDHIAHLNEFQTLLELKLQHDDAVNVLKTAIVWGRYANLFEYDSKSQEFSLESKE